MSERDEKWTPGPWRVLGDDAGPGDIPFIEVVRGDYGPEFKSIADVRCTDDDKHDFELTDDDWANAHLTAASPELYSALKTARDALASLPEGALGWVEDNNSLNDPNGWPVRDEMLHHIDTILAKARGEAQ